MRTTLIPGLLKTVRENRSHALPLRIFETSDVVFKDTTRERQARNVRHAAAVWCNKTAGFEVVHGLLDRAMRMLEVPKILSTDMKAVTGYYIKESSGKPAAQQFGQDKHSPPFRSCLLPRPCCCHLLPATRYSHVQSSRCGQRYKSGPWQRIRHDDWHAGSAPSQCIGKVRDFISLLCSRIRFGTVQEGTADGLDGCLRKHSLLLVVQKQCRSIPNFNNCTLEGRGDDNQLTMLLLRSVVHQQEHCDRTP